MIARRKVAFVFVALIAACCRPGACPAAESPGDVTSLSQHVLVYHGPTNVGILRDGSKALLIDCGEGSVAAVLPRLGITAVDTIWFTHHHRDQACGAQRFAAGGARIGVPASERAYFENVAAYWQNPKSRWHLYDQHPDHLMLAESVRVDATLAGGQTIAWGPAKITAIKTPGHTDGSLSFFVEADGKRIVFCGDAIFDAGQLWELWSLQKGPVGVTTSDYFGFLGARRELAEGLKRIEAARPDALVPSHGRIMREPSQAIDLLVGRLNAAHDRYFAISSARRFCSPEVQAEYSAPPNYMPIRPGKPVPACVRRLGSTIGDTTWLLISRDKAALAMDCGRTSAIKRIQTMLAKGDIRSVEGLWVTHYHDDHVDAIPAFQTAFPNCPCITDRWVADVITRPMAWRLPCISPSRARVDRTTSDGQSWPWHEFKLTAYHFPGHTLYHAGLLAEGQGLRLLFAGDAFTPAGIEDECMHNRNWLGPGVGYDRCIALVQQLRPTHIFHCHVDRAFDFTDEECRFMRAKLAEREKLLAELVPWDNPNYGLDEAWVRCDPYEQTASPGSDASIEVVVTNHSSQPRRVACRPILPRAWDGRGTDPAWPSEAVSGACADWPAVDVPAKTEGRVRLPLPIPSTAKPGRYVIPVDVRYDRWALPQFKEAIVELR